MVEFLTDLLMKLGFIVLSALVVAVFAGVAHWLKALDEELGPILMGIWVIGGTVVGLVCAWTLILK